MKDPGSLSQDTTLGDLGLDSLMGVEVKQTLERDYDLTLPMPGIRALTFSKLKNISSGSTKEPGNIKRQESVSIDEEKFSGRFNPRQLMPSDTLIQLSEGDASQGVLFVVHPIEGVLVSLQPVMERVNRTVYGLQCTKDAPMDSIAELAAFYIKASRQILHHIHSENYVLVNHLKKM